MCHSMAALELEVVELMATHTAARLTRLVKMIRGGQGRIVACERALPILM